MERETCNTALALKAQLPLAAFALAAAFGVYHFYDANQQAQWQTASNVQAYAMPSGCVKALRAIRNDWPGGTEQFQASCTDVSPRAIKTVESNINAEVDTGAYACLPIIGFGLAGVGIGVAARDKSIKARRRATYISKERHI